METKLQELQSLMGIDAEIISLSLEDFIRSSVHSLEREGVILGLSGGIDSATVAVLCERALGPENVLALLMPDRDSQPEHVRDALSLAKDLNIATKVIDLTPYLKKFGTYELFMLDRIPFIGKIPGNLTTRAYEFYTKRTGETPFSAGLLGFKNKQFSSLLKKSNAYYRIKHRLRMVLLYLNAELENKLVVGAANKSEAQIGFFVKHGCDDAVDIMPMINLYKTQVKQLAHHLNIPSRILEKAPSPDIIPGGIADEEVIGMPYDKLDLILLALEKGWGCSEIAEALNVTEKDITYVNDLIQRSEHMRKIYTP